MIRIQIILLAVLIGCSSQKNAKTTSLKDTEPVVFMKKTSCYGTCPEYELSIYEDGKVHLLATKHLDIEGQFQSSLNTIELDTILSAFEGSNFFEFEDEYTASYSDLPTTYVKYRKGDQEKKIKDYYGAPQSLKDLESMLEMLVNELDWERIN